jgi:hypothetical protein
LKSYQGELPGLALLPIFNRSSAILFQVSILPFLRIYLKNVNVFYNLALILYQEIV